MQNFLPQPHAPQNPQPNVAPVVTIATQAPATQPPRPKKRWKRALLVLFLCACIAVLGVLLFAASRLGQSFARLQRSSDTAQSAIAAGDFDAADAALGEASQAITDAMHGMRLIQFLRIVPWVGTQIRGLSYTLEAGNATVTTLQDAVGIMKDIADITRDAERLVGITDGDVPYHDLSASARVALLGALHDAYPEFLQMQMRLTLAEDDMARLKNLHVSPFLEDAVEPFVQLLTPLHEGVDLLTPFAAVVPELAGLGEDRQFLLLFANNTELRPGGGFLGVYGLAVTRDGEIVRMTTEDTYAIDGIVPEGYTVPAPAPIRDHLGVGGVWYFRDSNWSPDFPTSTTDGIQLLRQEYGAAGQPVPEIHGVLMFTPAFISRLLTLIGPVTVDDQTFTAQNIADKIEYQVEQGYVGDDIPAAQRKDIVARMTDVVVDKLIALPSSSWPELFSVLGEGFAAKEIALWSGEETTEAVYRDAGWAGEVTPGAVDSLMVVDANLGALKTDAVMERSLRYAVTPSLNGYTATATVTYTNNGTYTWKTTRYQTYTRLYVPRGSVLVQGPEGTATGEDLGLTTFGAYLVIPPGETQSFTFTYALPTQVSAAIADGSYDLLLQKQLGADTHDVTLHLAFGKPVTYATPSETSTNFGDDAYDVQFPLTTDTAVHIDLGR